MDVFDVVGTSLALLAALSWALFVRRRWLSRSGGVVDMAVRMRRRGSDSGSLHWTHGFARFEGDRLLWFRTFSLSPRPRHELQRDTLHVRSRRAPRGAETAALVTDTLVLVLECACADALAEFALHESAAPGLLSWLEATPGRVSA